MRAVENLRHRLFGLFGRLIRVDQRRAIDDLVWARSDRLRSSAALVLNVVNCPQCFQSSGLRPP